MKFNPKLKSQIEKYKDYIIVVEGKKDVNALKALDFKNVYAIHVTGTPLKERVEQIMQNVTKKDRVCILTDLDKKGKQLYLHLKPIFQELGARLDASLRTILLKAHLSHIEGINKFLDKIEAIH